MLSRRAAAADRALHRRGPARVDARPNDAGPERDRRVRLAADARPEELRPAEPLGELRGDSVDELASAHLEQLRDAARDDGEVLPPLRRVPRERAAIEDPVRIRREQRGERRRQQPTIEPEVDAHDRRALETGVGLAEEACALRRRHGDDDSVDVELVQRLDPVLEPDAISEHPAGGVAVHRAERLAREDQVSVAARPEERGANREQAGAGVDLVCAEIERRADEDVPEAIDGEIARTEAPQHYAERLARARLRAAAARRDDWDAQPVAQR